MTKPITKFNLYRWGNFGLERAGTGKTGFFPNEFSSLEDAIDHVKYRRTINSWDANTQFVITETNTVAGTCIIAELLNSKWDMSQIINTKVITD